MKLPWLLPDEVCIHPNWFPQSLCEITWCTPFIDHLFLFVCGDVMQHQVKQLLFHILQCIFPSLVIKKTCISPPFWSGFIAEEHHNHFKCTTWTYWYAFESHPQISNRLEAPHAKVIWRIASHLTSKHGLASTGSVLRVGRLRENFSTSSSTCIQW